MENQLYEFTIRALCGDGCEMPTDIEGAFIPTYVGATDFKTALKKGVSAIAQLHFVFEGVEGNVREIPIESWDNYVSSVWPEIIEHFPSRVEVQFIASDGGVFFGPFVGFSKSK